MPTMEREYNSSNNLTQTRIHLLGARGIEGIITVPATGAASLNWLFYDGHGNMVRAMNTAFALSAYQWRGVWGERTTQPPSRGYCANLGHPKDETGLVYMRARYYEPTTGRFISEDPAHNGKNWFIYCHNDPVNYVDNNGLSELPEAGLPAFWMLAHVFAAGVGLFLGIHYGHELFSHINQELVREGRGGADHTDIEFLNKVHGIFAEAMLHGVAGVINYMSAHIGMWTIAAKAGSIGLTFAIAFGIGFMTAFYSDLILLSIHQMEKS